MSTKYIGWISNLQGRLFFNLFDPYGFRYDKTIGEIFFYKDKDSNFFFWSGIIDFRDSQSNDSFKELRCFFVAKKYIYNSNELLKGKFFIAIENDNDKIKIKELYDLTINKDNDIKNYLEKIRKFQEFLEFNIKIFQNGIIEINSNLDSKDIFENQKSEEYFFLNIFLLIKSFFHKDRFHNKKSEHINLVVKSEDEIEAIKKFVFFIQRYIAEERKKFDNNIIIYNLVGVTNYLTTLLYIIKEKDENYYNRKIAFVKNLRDSLKEEKKEESAIKSLIVSSAIASLSLVGVYKILEINTAMSLEKKEQILQSLIPNFILWFMIIIFIFTVYDYIKTKAIPFSLSNNPLLKIIVRGYNFLHNFLIKNTKPNIGTNIFTKIIIPFFRRKLRDLNIKITTKN